MQARLVGGSVWEEELYEHLISHERNERELLVEYQQVARECDSPAFRYLVSLIVEDEIRHHRIFAELASSLKSDAEFRPEEPAVPRLDAWGRHSPVIAELANRLLDHEHEDQKLLRRLRRDLDDVKDTTMWDLLVRLMEMDTEKHVAILEFVRRHARKPGFS